jgi:hypothetical protein
MRVKTQALYGCMFLIPILFEKKKRKEKKRKEKNRTVKH